MEMRQVYQREGREAKNLMAYHLSIFDDFNLKSGMCKPPVVPKTVAKKPMQTSRAVATGARVRSASTGRDKRSELQARYWALLFDNLKRAINEIYQTVECYENISSCQEAILVLENYVRDFKALAEWFRVSWDYETTPQRHQSLAWDVRKSNPMPRLRAKSLSSPSPPILSGKSSPCPSYSGKSSPCSATEDSKSSPRKKFLEQISSSNADAVLKIPGSLSDGVKALKSPRSQLSQIKEDSPNPSNEQAEKRLQIDSGNLFITENKTITKELPNVDIDNSISWNDIVDRDNQYIATSQPEVNEKIEKSHQYSQTDLEEDNLTLVQWREKYEKPSVAPDEKVLAEIVDVKIEPLQLEPVSAVDITVRKLNEMENEFLAKQPNTPGQAINSIPIKLPEANVAKPTVVVPSISKSPKPLPLAQKQPLDKRPTTVSANQRVSSSSATILRPSLVTSRSATMIRSSRFAAPNPIAKSISNPTVPLVTVRRPLLKQSNATPSATRFSTSNPIKSSTGDVANSKRDVANSNNKRRDTIGPLHVANRLSARSKTMIDMGRRAEKNPQCGTFISKNSREDVASSSSTLKASTEQISAMNSRGGSVKNLAQMSRNDTKYRRSEPKTSTTEENDGWLTVKAKRRSSLHWANRFNQPTGYASLPTLIIPTIEASDSVENIDEKSTKLQAIQSVKKDKKPIKKDEQQQAQKLNKCDGVNSKPKSITNPVVKAKVTSAVIKEPDTKLKRTQSTKAAPTKPIVNQSKSSADIKLNVMKPSTSRLVTRESIIQRQKSDLTGLKITKLHKEFMRNEKFNNKNKPFVECVSLASTSSPKIDDFLRKNRIDMNIQTNMGLSKAINDLYSNSTKYKDEGKVNENGIHDPILTSSCDEIDDREDIESDEDQRKLLEEQESLEQQIRELQNTEIDVDTETDETDCDCEVILDMEENDSNVDLIDDHLSMDNDEMSLEMRYQLLLSDMTLGERVETLATLQAFVSRHPGRAQELHKKLSSPSRRRSLQETLKKYQAKQARAQAKREALMKEKALKLQVLLARVEDVKAAKQQLIDDKRLRMEERLQRATENRTQYLKDKIRKAHDEEAKLQEIAFIKNLEARIKKLDFMESWKEQEGRLQDIEQERQKKAEEKAAKEAAAERRRTELELERQRRLEKMNETRREREQRIGQMQEQNKKMRLQIARTKAKDREERLLALQVQQQQTTEELQRKINQKQQESARRHEENIEHIRQRALELSIPTRNVDENGQRVESADRGEEDLSSVVSDVSREHNSKANRKRLKKLKQRMAVKTEEYVNEMQQVPAYMRRDSEVPKLLAIIKKGGGPQGIERPLGQLLRLIAKAQVFDFQCFWLLDGLGVISKVIDDGLDSKSDLSRKAIILAVQIYRDSCSPCPQIARHAILGNSILTICDVLLQSLQTPDERTPLHPVELSTELMLACTVALSPSSALKQTHPKVLERLPDLISYVVSIGLVDVLSKRCLKIHEVVENHQNVVLSLLATLGLLTKIAELCPKAPDVTKFLSSIKSTDLFGTISLLHSTVVPVGECIPPRTISLAAATFNLLVTVANLDLPSFQTVLGEESLCFQFMDVVTILLKYCSPKCQEKGETQAVVIDLVATIGFFCANNKKNQNLITSEQSSVIIKFLTKLPKIFEMVIYPTLITIITGNPEAKIVVGRDFNLDFLEEYRQSELAKKNKLISIIN